MALNQVGLERLNTATTKKIGTSKNLIINGAFQIAQRNTTSTGEGMFTVDRFENVYSGVDENPTQEQANVTSGGAYNSGFRKCFKITNGNQTSGAGAADFISVRTKLEAQSIASSGWNYTSSSSYVTLSFWVKSSVAQNFYGYIRTYDGTALNFPFETGSLTADTWTKITKTIPGNASLTFDNDTNKGLEIYISPFWGTDRTASSVTLNQWQGYSDSTRVPDYGSAMDDWYLTNNATFEVTGVQLEVGSVATDFEFRSYNQELDLCYRYFQKIPSDGNLMGQVGRVNGTTVSDTNFNLTKVMRAQPSVTLDSSGGFAFEYGSNAVGVSSASVSGISAENVFMRFNLSGSATNGDATYMQLSAGSFMKCSAEI